MAYKGCIMGLYLPLLTDPPAPTPFPLASPVPALLLPKYIKHYSAFALISFSGIFFPQIFT